MSVASYSPRCLSAELDAVFSITQISVLEPGDVGYKASSVPMKKQIKNSKTSLQKIKFFRMNTLR